MTACPVGAIVADTRLTAAQLPFVDINAAYYPPRPAGAKVPPATGTGAAGPTPRTRRTDGGGGRLRAGRHVRRRQAAHPGPGAGQRLRRAAHAVRTGPGRGGSGPADKAITGLFDRMSRRDGFRFYLNVTVGQHISHDELLEHHHAVLYTVGSAHERRLDVEGMHLPGTGSATTNSSAGSTAIPFRRSAGRPQPPDGGGDRQRQRRPGCRAHPHYRPGTACGDGHLRRRTGGVAHVGGARGRRCGHRGPAESAFTLPELIGLTTGSHVVLDDADRVLVKKSINK